MLSLAPLPMDHKPLLERVPDNVVTANPLSPLFHRRPVQPVFRGTAPPAPTGTLTRWEPSQEYQLRQGTMPAGGGLRKKNQFLGAAIPKPLPVMPLPPHDDPAEAPRPLHPSAAKREFAINLCAVALRFCWNSGNFPC